MEITSSLHSRLEQIDKRWIEKRLQEKIKEDENKTQKKTTTRPQKSKSSLQKRIMKETQLQPPQLQPQPQQEDKEAQRIESIVNSMAQKRGGRPITYNRMTSFSSEKVDITTSPTKRKRNTNLDSPNGSSSPTKRLRNVFFFTQNKPTIIPWVLPPNFVRRKDLAELFDDVK